MPVRRPLCLLALLSVPLLLFPARGQAQASLESQVMAMINEARSKRVIPHQGVRSVAWQHSADMASDGGLHHANADARISNAPPDPAEANGAPDDGYGRDWCENVTYVNFGSEAEAAGHIYEAWRRSSPHHRCMQDTSLNVGAVGIYYDGNTWWATFIAMIDNTPPGAQDTSGPPAKTAAPAAREKAPAAEVPQPASEDGGAAAPSGNGATQAASQGAAASVPGAEEAPTTPIPAGREVYVISGPVEIAGNEAADTERVPAKAAALRIGYHEAGASVAAILLGTLVALLRLKRRWFKPRKVKRIVRNLGNDGPAPIRTPLPHSGRRERAAGARRQPELARG
ncbi:MAG: CAP domain-containing protein [Actinomycetota bacterium]